VVVYGGERDWPYFFMDVEHLGYLTVIFYFGLLAIQVLFWLLLYKIDQAKTKLIASRAAAKEGLMPGAAAESMNDNYAPPTMEMVEPL
jgi:hypothetical protein